MNNNLFWSEALKYGAILGAVMGVSFIFENYIMWYGSMPIVKASILYLVEWIAVAVVYVWLLYRFTKRYSLTFEPEEGFTFIQGFGFVITLILLMSVIVGVTTTIFYSVAGFDGFVSGYMARIDEMMLVVGENNIAVGSMSDSIEAMRDEVRALEQPSMFVSILSSINHYAFTGLIVGAIIAWSIRRQPIFVDKE